MSHKASNSEVQRIRKQYRPWRKPNITALAKRYKLGIGTIWKIIKHKPPYDNMSQRRKSTELVDTTNKRIYSPPEHKETP